MSSEEFCDRYLPESWGERDLQLLLQRKMRTYKLLQAPDEVRIKTFCTTRRADLATWLTVYEIKKYLTRDNIFHAVAQSEMYVHYGDKLFWIIPKRRVIVGLAPTEYQDYQSALSVAKDFRAMGIDVIFVNEFGLNISILELKVVVCAIAVSVIIFIGLIISSYFLANFF